MTDLKGLKCHAGVNELNCLDCPYFGKESCSTKMSVDTLEYVQELETVCRHMFNRCITMNGNAMCRMCVHRELCEKTRASEKTSKTGYLPTSRRLNE